MGNYFEDDVPEKLEIGKSYTEKELLIFVVENEDSVILCEDISMLNECSTRKHTVKNIIKAYPHYSTGKTYQIISKQKTYYVI
jgi:hypothetical protein